MPIHKVWKITDQDNNVTKEQIEACYNDRILAVLLKNRGILTPSEMTAFLNPLKCPLSDCDVFSDMQKAFLRIKDAVDKKEHITIYGDFDADGVTSTALLYLTLKKIGAQVDYYLPDRSTESHGLNTKALIRIISKRMSKLIITVDCGISNVNEIKFAKGFNTDIIVTDHHEAPEVLPDAYAIINPKAENAVNPNLSVEEIRSLNNLAGVGVAFKLACKILQNYNEENYVNELLPLAAIGTIGDVVNLTGENRTITAMGIELIKSGRHKGIQKLISASGIDDISNLTSENIAFGIVPRINAAGRLESPNTSLKILISDDDNEINSAIDTLDKLNIKRQSLCDEIFQSAKSMYEADKISNQKCIILFNENWHIGIIGIVSSKLTEEYNKPVFLMTKDIQNPDIIRCSARGINEINIYDILSEHKEFFEGFGGHKMAAGFSFSEKKISFDGFKKLLSKSVEEACLDVDMSQTSVNADMIVEPEDITQAVIEHFSKLEPFGASNPYPLFVMNDLTLKQYKFMGQSSNHLKIFAQKNNMQLECIKWNCPNFTMSENSTFNILFVPKINEYNGAVNIQYMLEDIHSESLLNIEKDLAVKILDHRNKKNILNQVLDFVNTTKKNTGIYIETPALKKQIEQSSKALQSLIDINRIPNNTEQLMFFECPSSREDFFYIIKNSNAKIIHLMNFNIPVIMPDNIISTLSGMLKYAYKNMNGVFELKKLANALYVNEQTVDDALNLFMEVNLIKIEQISDSQYKIISFNPIELSKIKHYDLYKTFEEDIDEINEFRKFYLNTETDKIKELI